MQKCLIVLGMHRSGTSAIMGAMHRMGVYLGSRLIVDHYENVYFTNLNDAILNDLGASWDDVFALPRAWRESPIGENFKKQLIATIAQEFGNKGLWGIKDPRISLLLPLWIEALAQLSIQPVFILALRNPFEVARSLAVRDNICESRSLCLWMKYFLEAEHHTRGFDRICYTFHQFLENPESAISTIHRCLKLDLPRKWRDAEKDVLAFMKPGLKHHTIQNRALCDKYPLFFQQIYQLLFDGDPAVPAIDTCQSALDNIRMEYRRHQQFFLSTSFQNKYTATKQCNDEMTQLLSETGKSHLEHQRFGEGVRLFSAMTELLPDRCIIWNNLGAAHEHAKDYPMAEQCYRKALSLAPGYNLAAASLKRVRQFLQKNISSDDLSRNNHSKDALPKQTGDREVPLYLGLVKGEGYGWGVCSRYLIAELSKIRPVEVLGQGNGYDDNGHLNGKLFQALTGADFFPIFKEARGTGNFAYTFFENELTDHSRENAKQYDLVLGGSTWCRDRMMEKGITNCDVLIQGIDPAMFYPLEPKKSDDRFVIFSGGKFELRKGQDMVLRAVKILQDKYPDVWLVNCWFNLWPASTQLMSYSSCIDFDYRSDESWQDMMKRTYIQNGLDPARIVTHEMVPYENQRDLYAQTDIGLFPNRCEGGTNLVMMEYMACARPVIASNTSGHRDILTPQNAICLNDMNALNIADADGALIGRWQEPSLEEIVAQLEYAYWHRENLQPFGERAGRDMKAFTWRHTADQLLKRIGLN